MSDDEYAVCPYISDHKVLRYRMPAHIVKCYANYIGPPLAVCAYNATHRVLSNEMEGHLRECNDFHYFQRAAYLKLLNQKN